MRGIIDNRRMSSARQQVPAYCRFCGKGLEAGTALNETALRCPAHDCAGHGCNHETGPQLLVLCFIFAQGHMLLLKRGIEPYVGYWAPPGGYVEAGESPESAAIRETREEVGVRLDSTSLMPFAISSVAAINQVYIAYLCRLEATQTPLPRAPEALDARWFPEDSFPLSDIWQPSHDFDMRAVFARLRSGRFELYQRTEDYLRVISEGERVTYLYRRPQEPDPVE
jgi:ADP-ribose pyrophosphatase YjhB (NUDIX family)